MVIFSYIVAYSEISCAREKIEALVKRYCLQWRAVKIATLTIRYLNRILN